MKKKHVYILKLAFSQLIDNMCFSLGWEITFKTLFQTSIFNTD